MELVQGKNLLVTNQEAVLAETLLYSVQRAVQLLLSSVICCLAGAEARLVNTIVDLHAT